MSPSGAGWAGEELGGPLPEPLPLPSSPWALPALPGCPGRPPPSGCLHLPFPAWLPPPGCPRLALGLNIMSQMTRGFPAPPTADPGAATSWWGRRSSGLLAVEGWSQRDGS